MEKALQIIKNSPHILKKYSWKQIKLYIQNNTSNPKVREIILLPQTASTLLHQHTNPKDNHYTINMCNALGIVGWAAWTAIDRVRDHEDNQSDEIHIFSSLRPIVDELINKIRPSKNDTEYLLKKIALMEYANSKSCTLTIHKRSVIKSIGVSIPLLIFMLKTGSSKFDLKSCEQYFFHLIAAKQLSDDAYDWKDDMQKRIDTPVTKWIQKIMLKQDNRFQSDEKMFNKYIREKTARAVLHHSRLSIKYAKAMTCFSSTEFLEELPWFYEDVALRIIAECKEKKDHNI